MRIVWLLQTFNLLEYLYLRQLSIDNFQTIGFILFHNFWSKSCLRTFGSNSEIPIFGQNSCLSFGSNSASPSFYSLSKGRHTVCLYDLFSIILSQYQSRNSWHYPQNPILIHIPFCCPPPLVTE